METLPLLLHGFAIALQPINLFFALIGMIYGRTHTRFITEMGGLLKALPITGGLLLVALFLLVSRAVWRGFEFLDIGRSLLKGDGLAIAMKGPRAQLEAVQHAAFSAPEIVPVGLPFLSWATRSSRHE